MAHRHVGMALQGGCLRTCMALTLRYATSSRTTACLVMSSSVQIRKHAHVWKRQTSGRRYGRRPSTHRGQRSFREARRGPAKAQRPVKYAATALKKKPALGGQRAPALGVSRDLPSKRSACWFYESLADDAQQLGYQQSAASRDQSKPKNPPCLPSARDQADGCRIHCFAAS